MGSGTGKVREVIEEFRAIVIGRGGLLDAMLPPVAFLVLNALSGLVAGMLAALVAAAGVVVVRLIRRQAITYALFGLGASLLALLLAQVLKRAEVFFLPDMITNLALAAASLGSVAIGQPLVAWTSHFVRRWPRAWYWHPRVRLAYTEVTLAWAVYFVAQVLLRWMTFQSKDPTRLAAIGLLSGWPATVALLIVSYLYGTWRLARLCGPSVAEFQAQAPPPWTGQRRGF